MTQLSTQDKNLYSSSNNVILEKVAISMTMKKNVFIQLKKKKTNLWLSFKNDKPLDINHLIKHGIKKHIEKVEINTSSIKNWCTNWTKLTYFCGHRNMTKNYFKF